MAIYFIDYENVHVDGLKGVAKLSEEAILSIKQYEKHENFLSELATYLIDREK